MAVPFYKLKEGDKLYKVDYVYDNDGKLIDYVPRNL